MSERTAGQPPILSFTRRFVSVFQCVRATYTAVRDERILSDVTAATSTEEMETTPAEGAGDDARHAVTVDVYLC